MVQRRSHRRCAHGVRTLLAGVSVLAVLVASPAAARTFDPGRVLSDGNMRKYDSMTPGQIQTFLNRHRGPLKHLSFARHDGGAVAPASVIIWEAAQAWHINPRVLLTMLQKEQSLITRRSLARHTLSRAVGAGCPDSGGNRYPGFGNQLWQGARLLDGYGEASGTTPYVPHPWQPGMRNGFTGRVRTYTLATYKLYVYNPSIGAKKPYGDLSKQSCSGNANFWKIWWAYWGSPLSTPTLTPVPAGVTTATIALAAPCARHLCTTPALLAGRLASADQTVAPVAGLPVHLESVSGNGWAPIAGSECAVGADGSFSFALNRTRLQRVRVVFGGGAGLTRAVSGLFVSDAVPILSTPTVTLARSPKAASTVAGTVAPADAMTVHVTLQHRDRGRWKAYKTFSASARHGSWRLRVKLPRGSWRANASVNDARFALGVSAWSTP